MGTKKDWSCALEAEEYEKDINLLIQDSFQAVEETGDNHYVNLVTPGIHGNPDIYLVPLLKKEFGDLISTKFIDQCGCGGYVLRVIKQPKAKN